MTKKRLYNKEEIDTSISNDSFVFNLGRLWQEVLSEHWDDVRYLYEFVKEITPPTKYSKGLKSLGLAIDKMSCEDVDKALKKILKW
ncbi:hypothetical protein KAW65_04005 [candidate division WOR-3 bacterium]|nr:hypothetical protein [candidate division WOR-3 bacterium]